MNEAMLLQYGLEPKKVEVLDSSMVGDFVNCPSMFYLKHILGLRPNRFDASSNIALDWGTCWHKGMYAYYKDGAGGNLEAALVAIAENFPDYITPQNDPKTKRSRDRMLKQMVAYHNHWSADNQNYEIIRSEQYFDVNMEKYGIRWCGRMDSIRRKLSPSKIQVWDYKTTSAMGDRYFDTHELSFQCPGYVTSANEMTAGEEVLELKLDVMYTLSASFQFFRKTFRYDAYRRQEWAANIKIVLERIYFLMDNHLYEPEMWYKSYQECTRYHTCMFFPVHNLHPKGDTRLRILSNDYHVDRWDPSAIED
jgi:hypothetical protein